MKYGKLISKLTKKSNHNGYVAVAIVAGLAAGAILSLLFAPESGEDSRNAISDKAKRLKNNAKDKFNAFKDKLGCHIADEIEEPLEEEIAPKPGKKPKSAIKEIIHEAHLQADGSE